MFNKQNLFSKPEGASPERRPTYPGTRSGRATTSSTTTKSSAATASSETRNESETLKDNDTMMQKDADQPTSDATETTGSQLIVGPDVKLKGAEILDCDTLVVEGRVEATMDSRVIRIADKGSFSGKVGIDVAEVHGEFEGELTARKQLVIHATGKVSGVIRYGTILIEEGGIVCGDVQSIDSADSAKSASVQALVVPSKG